MLKIHYVLMVENGGLQPKHMSFQRFLEASVVLNLSDIPPAHETRQQREKFIYHVRTQQIHIQVRQW